MKKRVFGILLSAVLILSAMGFAIPMTAMADSMMVVTVGADLTEEQKNMILRYFNVAGQSYTTITVTNDDEWRHLGGYMSRDIVGYKTISCALIRPMTSGGIQVKTANLTYVTSNMIASNLATAGVTNCEVLAAAPFQVSGTGALTGALMAYENLSGVTLEPAKKEAAVQEFATTYELGQTIGQQEAQQIVNDVKMQVINGTLEEDNSISYEEITKIVNDVVNNYTTNNITNNTTNTTTNNTTNITNNNGLTEAEVASLMELAVSISQQTYDSNTLDALAQIQKTLEGQTQTPSTASTTQIEQNAAPTAEPAAAPTEEPAAAPTDTASQDQQALSAADQALSQDSILNTTDESALAETSSDGSVITSSTAQTTIDLSVSTDLDEKIEQQQQEQQEQQAPADQNVTNDTGIPEPTDFASIGGDDTTDQNTAQSTDPAIEIPADTVENPDANTIDPFADGTVDTPDENPDDLFGDGMEENPGEVTDGNVENPTDDAAVADTQNAVSITADDVFNGTVSFRVCSNAENGSQPASGVSPVEVVVPYENLTPVSGALHVTSSSGADAALFNIDPSAQDLVLLTSQDSPDVPAGSTKILMVPKDVYDISLMTDYVPVAGESYTYTLSAQFSMGDQMLDIQINNYDPYNGNGVSEKGFSVNGSCLNKSYTEGITGSVLFPSDGMSTFATVTADGQSMASVAITAADGSAPYGVSAGAGDVVTVTPVQSGPVTLTITYYSAAPEDGVSVDPAAATGTAQYTIYFS
jgi:uncharacterized protein YpuA (DUF1002 family)